MGLNILVPPLFIAAYAASYFGYQDVSAALSNNATKPDMFTDGELFLNSLLKMAIAAGFFAVLAGFYGMISGLVIGMVAGITTVLFYFPLANRQKYQLSISVLVAVLSFAWPLIMAFWEKDLSLWTRFGLVPGLLIACANVLIAGHFAGWYEREWIKMPHSADRHLEASV
jgi:uncharacterized membrane-anchored protein